MPKKPAAPFVPKRRNESDDEYLQRLASFLEDDNISEDDKRAMFGLSPTGIEKIPLRKRGKKTH